MSWEKRGNRSYYYSKTRLRGSSKIDSTYWGSSKTAKFIAECDWGRRLNIRVDKDKEKTERKKYKTLNKEIVEVEDFIRCLARAVFLMNDYHFHKGSLRKLRKPVKEKENELTCIVGKK